MSIGAIQDALDDKQEARRDVYREKRADRKNRFDELKAERSNRYDALCSARAHLNIGRSPGFKTESVPAPKPPTRSRPRLTNLNTLRQEPRADNPSVSLSKSHEALDKAEQGESRAFDW